MMESITHIIDISKWTDVVCHLIFQRRIFQLNAEVVVHTSNKQYKNASKIYCRKDKAFDLSL